MTRSRIVAKIVLIAVVSAVCPVSAQRTGDHDTSDWTPLMKAVKEGDTRRVNAILLEAELVKQDRINEASLRERLTPLMVAAIYEQGFALEILLKNNPPADPDRRSREGFTALMFAARTGNIDTVQTLLHVKPNLALTSREEGETALMFAILSGKPEVVRSLIQAGANVNTRDHNGTTPLILAASKGNAEIVKELLAARADPKAKEDRGYSAQDAARAANHPELIPLLTASAGALGKSPTRPAAPRASGGQSAVHLNVKYQSVPVPPGWATFTSKTLNATLALPGQPTESSAATAIPEGTRQDVTLALQTSNGAGWNATYSVRRLTYPDAIASLGDGAFLARAIKDVIPAGVQRLLTPIQAVGYGPLDGRAIHFTTKAADGTLYESYLEVYRDREVAYAVILTTLPGGVAPELARAYSRNVRLHDTDLVCTSGAILESEPAPSCPPDLEAETVPAPSGWIVYEPRGFHARFALPGTPVEKPTSDQLPDGILHEDYVGLAAPEGNTRYSLFHFTMPADWERLDDETFFMRSLEFVLGRGTFERPERARQVLYRHRTGRVVSYRTELEEFRLEMFRYRSMLFAALTNAPRGKIDEATARAFFRNVRWLELVPEGADGPLFATEADSSVSPADLRAERIAPPAGWLPYAWRNGLARGVFPTTATAGSETSCTPAGTRKIEMIRASLNADYTVAIYEPTAETARIEDDDAFYTRILQYVAIPGRHHLREPARRVAYGPLTGRSASYESVQRYAGHDIETESLIEIYRSGPRVFIASVNAIRGTLNRELARAFFRNVEWRSPDSPGPLTGNPAPASVATDHHRGGDVATSTRPAPARRAESEPDHDALHQLLGKDADLSSILDSNDVNTDPDEPEKPTHADSPAAKAPGTTLRPLGVIGRSVVVNPAPPRPQRRGEPPAIGGGSQPPMAGVQITSITQGSPAQRAGLKVGDVVIYAGPSRAEAVLDLNTRTMPALERAAARSRGILWLAVLRGGRYGDSTDIRVDLR